MYRRELGRMRRTDKPIRNKVVNNFWLFVAVVVFFFCVGCFLPFLLIIILPVIMLVLALRRNK